MMWLNNDSELKKKQNLEILKILLWKLVKNHSLHFHETSMKCSKYSKAALVETAGTFYMLQACVQGNCL